MSEVKVFEVVAWVQAAREGGEGLYEGPFLANCPAFGWSGVESVAREAARLGLSEHGMFLVSFELVTVADLAMRRRPAVEEVVRGVYQMANDQADSGAGVVGVLGLDPVRAL